MTPSRTEMKPVDLPDELPILAVRNTVLFPGVVLPITVSRKKSVKLVRKAHSGGLQRAFANDETVCCGGHPLPIVVRAVGRTVEIGTPGTLIGLVRALPQLLRLVRERNAHGVSLDTAATSSIVSGIVPSVLTALGRR